MTALDRQIIEAEVGLMGELLQAILNEIGCGCCTAGGSASAAAQEHGLEVQSSDNEYDDTWPAIEALRDKILDLYREALGEASGLQ